MGSDPLKDLERLHAEVDTLAKKLEALHRSRLECRRGCFDCCVDDISVFEVEAEKISRGGEALLASAEPHPVGRCSFLDDEGACRIYELRPYVCRTQGLPLRWLGETPEGTIAEFRDICPLNEEGKPIETLDESECWSIGPFETRLAEIQRRIDGGEGKRVKLRNLWRRQA